MIGYHYTSLRSWEDIQYRGLEPDRIRQHEYGLFVTIAPRLPRDAIWVWQHPLDNEQACITTFSLAAMHSSFEIVLLRITYDESDAASIVYDDTDPQDTTQFICSFTAGRLSTGRLPIELLINSIPPEQIEKIWEINLLDHMKGRHVQSHHAQSHHTPGLFSRFMKSITT